MQQKSIEPEETAFTGVEVDYDCIFWPYVWKHANECRDKRLQTERRLRCIGALAGTILAVILAAAVWSWVGLT